MLVAGGAVGYWLYGDRLPSVLARAASGAADRVTVAAVRTSERLDSEEGARIAAEQDARRRGARAKQDEALGWVTVNVDSPVVPKASPLAPLRRRSGPAYVSLRASEVAGVLAPLLKLLPPSAVSAQLALDGDRLLLRSAVALGDFAGHNALRTLLGTTPDGEDTLFLAGPLEPVSPGLAQLRVRELRLKGVDVPTRLIPSLVSALRERAAAASVDRAGNDARLAPDALPVPLPAVVSDVRVVNGKLTLYRASGTTSSPTKE